MTPPTAPSAPDLFVSFPAKNISGFYCNGCNAPMTAHTDIRVGMAQLVLCPSCSELLTSRLASHPDDRSDRERIEREFNAMQPTVDTAVAAYADMRSRNAKLIATLKEHWLWAMECDHKTKTDVARCSCSQWACAPQPSIGAAVEQWAQHVAARLASPGEDHSG